MRQERGWAGSPGHTSGPADRAHVGERAKYPTADPSLILSSDADMRLHTSHTSHIHTCTRGTETHPSPGNLRGLLDSSSCSQTRRTVGKWHKM